MFENVLPPLDICFSPVPEKVLKELIEPYSERVQRLREFLQDTKPSLQVEIVPLEDPFGVSIVDPLLKCIVVSEETRKGGEAVNKKRVENVRWNVKHTLSLKKGFSLLLRSRLRSVLCQLWIDLPVSFTSNSLS
ncbi:hypothetical protein ILYODFUR_030088 [Ilyodon furcidens]|uniref:Uncharacterized protein n=1 Tax=Ilyodon furcidens TaxID=33524 RepID=A0ABV0VAQ1_9TELE